MVIFRATRFRHIVVWNDRYARIEIYLEAQSNIGFTIAGQQFSMSAGQRLHVENSHKYDLRDARLLLRAGGWSPVEEWSDEHDYFTLFLAEARPYKRAP